MDINPAGPGTTSQAQSTRQPSALSSDFETFLKMLTVQMKNQDPLNPIESTDFAVQLATFSGVEQQVKTNDLLSRLAEVLGASGMSKLAGWIGSEVRSSGPVRFDGAPLTLYPGPGTDNGAVSFLVVRDSAGLPVSREPLLVTGEPFTWAGARPDGSPFPSGLYTFEIEQMEGETVIATVDVEHYAKVGEVRAGTDGPILVLAGGAEVASGDVTAVRRASVE